MDASDSRAVISWSRTLKTMCPQSVLGDGSVRSIDFDWSLAISGNLHTVSSRSLEEPSSLYLFTCLRASFQIDSMKGHPGVARDKQRILLSYKATPPLSWDKDFSEWTLFLERLLCLAFFMESCSEEYLISLTLHSWREDLYWLYLCCQSSSEFHITSGFYIM